MSNFINNDSPARNQGGVGIHAGALPQQIHVGVVVHPLINGRRRQKVPTHFESKPNRRGQHLDGLLYRSKSDDENCWFTEMFS